MRYRGEIYLVFEMLNQCNEKKILSHIGRDLKLNSETVSKLLDKALKLGLVERIITGRKKDTKNRKRPLIEYITTPKGNEFKQSLWQWCKID